MIDYLELLYLISFTGVLAVGYSYLLSGQILSSSPGNARMQEIAEALKKQREAKGMSLDDLFQRTRIKLDFLKALEAGQASSNSLDVEASQGAAS